MVSLREDRSIVIENIANNFAVGPLIASKYFFSGENANSLETVQYVYLAVALLGVAVGVMFFFAKLPEVAEAATQRRGSVVEDSTLELATDVNGNVIGAGPIWKQYNLFFGFAAQFCYVGAQVRYRRLPPTTMPETLY